MQYIINKIDAKLKEMTCDGIVHNLDCYDDFVESFKEIVDEAKQNHTWSATIPHQQDLFFEHEKQKTLKEYVQQMVYENVVNTLKKENVFNICDEDCMLNKEHVDRIISATLAKWSSVGINISKSVTNDDMLMFISNGYTESVDYISKEDGYTNKTLTLKNDNKTDLLIQFSLHHMDFQFFKCVNKNGLPEDRFYDLDGSFVNHSFVSIPAAEAYIVLHPLMCEKSVQEISSIGRYYNNVETSNETCLTIPKDEHSLLKDVSLRSSVLKHYAQEISKEKGYPVDMTSESVELSLYNKKYNMSPASFVTAMILGGFSSHTDERTYGNGKSWEHNTLGSLMTLIDIDETLSEKEIDYYFFNFSEFEKNMVVKHGIMHDVISIASKENAKASPDQDISIARCDMSEDNCYVFYESVQNKNVKKEMDIIIKDSEKNNKSAPLLKRI